MDTNELGSGAGAESGSVSQQGTGWIEKEAEGWQEQDRVPLEGVMSIVEALLREPRRVFFHLHDSAHLRVGLALFAMGLFGFMAYGLVMGSFSGGAQWWASTVKMGGGMVVASLICFPSLYVFSGLAGCRANLGQLWGMVSGLLAMLAMLLIGFAPVMWLFSQSTGSVVMMGFFHFLAFLTGMYFAMRFFLQGLKPWVRKGGLGMVFLWMVVFLLVMLQMSTTLRPLIGTSETFLPEEKRFFLGHWFEELRKAGERD